MKSDLFLAPMAGITDVAFRLLCQRYGAELTFTEMISANALSRKNKATLKLLDTKKQEKVAIQLFGQNTENLVKAAKYCQNKCQMLDLNFGCPASKIIQQGSGSALLERPNKIKEIVEAVSSSIKIPVSCKLRLGIKKSSINVLEIAEICQNAGAKLISLHARTQKQGYTGKADWNWIKKIKDNLKIKVAGNGDVRTPEDYQKMKSQTNCDYVMIGRGTLGNPYLFQQILDYHKQNQYKKRTKEQQVNDFFEYLGLAQKYKVNFNQIKFHAQAFTKGIKNSTKLRLKLSQAKNLPEVRTIYSHV